MSRRYSEPVRVCGLGRAPGQFVWRGRRYEVCSVLAHWVESGAWWGGSRRVLEGAIPPNEVEFWRVEARWGRATQTGVYELCRNTTTDNWLLTRALD